MTPHSKTLVSRQVFACAFVALLFAVAGCRVGKAAVESTDGDTDVTDSETPDTDVACEYYDAETYCERFMAEHPPCTGEGCLAMRCLPDGDGPVCAEIFRFRASHDTLVEFRQSCRAVGTLAAPDPYECPDGELQWNVFCNMDPCP